MNAICEVMKRMFEKEITVRTEPMNPYQDDTGTRRTRLAGKKTFNNTKERVDMIVTDETDIKPENLRDVPRSSIMYLIEGKNPNVMEDLAKLFKKGKTFEVDLYINRGNKVKILNKV